MTDRDIKNRLKSAFDNIHADEKTIKAVEQNRVRPKRNRFIIAGAAAAAAAVLVFAVTNICEPTTERDLAAAKPTLLPQSAGTAVSTDAPIPTEASEPTKAAATDKIAAPVPKQEAVKPYASRIPAPPAGNMAQPQNTPESGAEAKPEPQKYSVAEMPMITAVMGVFESDTPLEFVESDTTARAKTGDDMVYIGSVACDYKGTETRLYGYEGDNGRYANIITWENSDYVDEAKCSPDTVTSDVSGIPVDDSKPDEIYFFYMNPGDNAYVVNTRGLTKQENMDLLYSLGGE